MDFFCLEHKTQENDFNLESFHENLFFAKPEKCTNSACAYTTHLPVSYYYNKLWIGSGNAAIFTEYAPLKTTNDYDTSDDTCESQSINTSHFDCLVYLGRNVTASSYSRFEKELNLRERGCRFINRSGTDYVNYYRFDSPFSFGLYSLAEMCLTKLADIHSSSSPSPEYLNLSALPDELQIAIQKRVCPDKQFSVGFEKIRTWHPNGQLCQEIPLVAGIFHGIATMWRPDGTVLAEISFENGQMHGPCITKSETRSITSKTMFRAGVPSSVRTVYIDGKIVETQNFHEKSCKHSIYSSISSIYKHHSRVYSLSKGDANEGVSDPSCYLMMQTNLDLNEIYATLNDALSFHSCKFCTGQEPPKKRQKKK